MQTLNKPGSLAIRMMQQKQRHYSGVIPGSIQDHNNAEPDLTMIDTPNNKFGDSLNEKHSSFYENAGFSNEEKKQPEVAEKLDNKVESKSKALTQTFSVG